eukprot:TRINITY_DN1291_c0_g1_i4.p1 TRINITY_DN1291_c0_g1~~TRINITY_DN1291_c0_g1_i4.p1  ORF type:complete len:158 (+),score=28.58 TRINITY_DN1291_c0_g1_i4:157-630(+)
MQAEHLSAPAQPQEAGLFGGGIFLAVLHMSAVMTANRVEEGQACFLDSKACRITRWQRSRFITCLTSELHEGGEKQTVVMKSRATLELAYVAVEEMQLLDLQENTVVLLDEDNEVHELPMPEDPRVAAELAKAAPMGDVMVEVTTIADMPRITRCLR